MSPTTARLITTFFIASLGLALALTNPENINTRRLLGAGIIIFTILNLYEEGKEKSVELKEKKKSEENEKEFRETVINLLKEIKRTMPRIGIFLLLVGGIGLYVLKPLSEITGTVLKVFLTAGGWLLVAGLVGIITYGLLISKHK